jgi:hypothetical protein
MFLRMLISLHKGTGHNHYIRSNQIPDADPQLPDPLMSEKKLPVLWAADVGNIHILDGLSEHDHADPVETNPSQKDQCIWGIHAGHHFVDPAHISAPRVCVNKQNPYYYTHANKQATKATCLLPAGRPHVILK